MDQTQVLQLRNVFTHYNYSDRGQLRLYPGK